MSDPKPLSFVLAAANLAETVPELPFTVTYDDEPYRVRRLLDRTVELESARDGYKVTLRQESVMVDPAIIRWARRDGGEPEAPRALTVVADDEGIEPSQPLKNLSEPDNREAPPPIKRSINAKAAKLYLNGRPLVLDASAQAKAEELLAQQGVQLEPAAAVAPGKAVTWKKSAGPDPKDYRAWRQEKDELAKTGERRCSECRQVKKLEDFPKSGGRCLVCNRQYQSDWTHNKRTDQAPAQEARMRISQSESRALAERGLKRCPKCGQDKPIAEFNTAGYCSCRFANGKSPSPAAAHLNVLRHPKAPAAEAKTALIFSGPASEPETVKGDAFYASVTPTEPRIASAGLLDKIRKLRQERDDARAELAQVYEQLEEALS